MAEAKTMKLKMVTPERVLFEQEVNRVTASTDLGQITVLPNHLALVTNIWPGEIIIEADGKVTPLVVSGGFLEICDNLVTILADTAEHVDQVNLAEAEEAIKLAGKLLKEKKYDLKEYETLERNLESHKAKVRSFNKWRK